MDSQDNISHTAEKHKRIGLFKQEQDKHFYLFFIKRIRNFIIQSNQRHSRNPFKYIWMFFGLVLIFLDCKFGIDSTSQNINSLTITMTCVYIIIFSVWLIVVI